MSLFQFIVIVASFVFMLFAIDLFHRRKFNILHFLVFWGGGAIMILFGYDVNLLNQFGSFFGIARGADLLVYIWLISLFYFYFEMLNAHTKQRFQFSRLITASAIREWERYEWSKYLEKFTNSAAGNDEYVFLVRGYNEEKSVGKVIDEIVGAGFSKIVVVNDGSLDGMAHVVEEKKKKYSDKMIILLSHRINRGRGAGNKTGFDFLRRYGKQMWCKRVVGFDGDDQMDIKDMKTFKESIQKNPDIQILLGSRFIEGGVAQDIPFSRRVILRWGNIVTYIFNRIWVSDPHNGFRVMRLEAVNSMKITSDDSAYANEINDEIRVLKLQYKEVPVHIKYTNYSLGKGQKNSNAIKILWELIYKKLFFK